ncbi:unnamed protein product [Mytilus edulis]|uniref:WSC domain-containing protein n=1 Tax=Mytilus edulis TaxID=6550 RepID=A0A8S3PZA9_MYTED|nr:unnamed protein product [Mytilus edulis]
MIHQTGPSIPSVQNEYGQCDRVEYPTLCQTFSACRADELCDADLKAYKASHNPAIGKRAAVQVCSACCEGNRCNQGGCQVLVKSCFNNIGTWDIPAQPYSPSQYEGNITSACSYECRKIKLFALKANRCACLNSLRNMVVTKMDNCKMVCNGSERDPCGDARYYTVYEQKDFENFQKAENGTTYNRRSEFKWIINKTFTEISNETADFHNVKCLLLNESLQYVPMSCNLNYSALCEAGSEKEITTETNDIDMETSLSTSQSKKTLISGISTTTSPGTSKSDFGTPTYVTVITVVGALITVGMAIVILLLYRRNRKRIIHHSRNSASNDIHASLEGEQTMQMFSSNDRSRNRTNTVPFILQHKQHPDNISVSKYQDPIDMENQYQRLDFSLQSDLKESTR